MRPLPAPRTTRRTTIGGALVGLVTFTGCDLTAPSSEPAPVPRPDADPDPDATLLDTVMAELDELAALVTRAADRRPQLAPDLAAFAALHLAHREALPERQAEPASPEVSGSARALAIRVVRREQQAQRRLADWSLAADSGPLARLLASMSAGVAAHLADTRLGRAAR